METSKKYFLQFLKKDDQFTVYKITKTIFYWDRKFKSKHLKFSYLLFL